MDISKAKFFLMSSDGTSPHKLELIKVFGGAVFLKQESANPEYDENVVKECHYFCNMDGRQIEEKILKNGNYCEHVDCWIYANHKNGITWKALKHLNCYLFRKHVLRGHSEVVKYLCDTEFEGKKLTIADIRSNKNYALRWAAINGHLDILKYLCETEFGGKKLTIGDVRANNNHALRDAANSGHLEIVKYLCESEFSGEKLTGSDIRYCYNQVVCGAFCEFIVMRVDVINYLRNQLNK